MTARPSGGFEPFVILTSWDKARQRPLKRVQRLLYDVSNLARLLGLVVVLVDPEDGWETHSRGLEIQNGQCTLIPLPATVDAGWDRWSFDGGLERCDRVQKLIHDRRLAAVFPAPEVVKAAGDKLAVSEIGRHAGVDTLPTALLSDAEQLLCAEPDIETWVVKRRRGFGGADIRFVTRADARALALHADDSVASSFVIQPSVQTAPSADGEVELRCYLCEVGNREFSTVYWRPVLPGAAGNMSLGNVPQPLESLAGQLASRVDLDEIVSEVRDGARRAFQHFRSIGETCEIAVDCYLKSNGSVVVFEYNAVPGREGLYQIGASAKDTITKSRYLFARLQSLLAVLSYRRNIQAL